MYLWREESVVWNESSGEEVQEIAECIGVPARKWLLSSSLITELLTTLFQRASTRKISDGLRTARALFSSARTRFAVLSRQKRRCIRTKPSINTGNIYYYFYFSAHDLTTLI
jgi:hypothetical protein